VKIQPGHLVGVLGNVIWVTVSRWLCGEHVNQVEMFPFLQYVVKLVIKTIILALLLGNRRWHGKQFVPK